MVMQKAGWMELEKADPKVSQKEDWLVGQMELEKVY